MNHKDNKSEPILAYVPSFKVHINITELVDLLQEDTSGRELTPQAIVESLEEAIKLISCKMSVRIHPESHILQVQCLMETLFALQSVFKNMNVLK